MRVAFGKLTEKVLKRKLDLRSWRKNHANHTQNFIHHYQGPEGRKEALDRINYLFDHTNLTASLNYNILEEDEDWTSYQGIENALSWVAGMKGENESSFSNNDDDEEEEPEGFLFLILYKYIFIFLTFFKK